VKKIKKKELRIKKNGFPWNTKWGLWGLSLVLPIPKGLKPQAQGREERVTLGKNADKHNPERG